MPDVMTTADRPPQPPAVSGDWHALAGLRAGRLGCWVAGQGAPLLLIHSINAAGSAYEVKPVFEGMRGERRVWAVDLPGFGTSDRSDRRYDIRLYVDAIHDALDAIAQEAGPVPVDALALSLSSEFLARAATERPERLRTLAFVTPTGFSRWYGGPGGPPGSSREVPGLHGALTVGLWSGPLYNLLVSRASIRFFLEKTFGSKRIDEGMMDYDWMTAHQPGAKHAPLAFLSGRLFSRDIRAVYERLTHPVWLPHGTKGDFRDFSQADWARDRATWTVQPYDTGALPHFEAPGRFLEDYRAFLSQAAGG